MAGACRATASRTITGLGSQGDDSALAVDFTLEAGGRSYPGLTFTYPTYASPVAVAEGSQVACFYDPDDPTQVTLMRKSAPEGRSPRATAHWKEAISGRVKRRRGIMFDKLPRGATRSPTPSGRTACSS